MRAFEDMKLVKPGLNSRVCFYTLFKFTVLVVILNLLTACTSEDDSSNGEVSITQSVSRQTLLSESQCFDNLGNIDAAIYVYSGYPLRPDDIDNFSPNPVNVVALTENNLSGNFYSYKLKFAEAGNFGVAVVCQAAADNASTSDQLVYMSNRWYKVDIKDTVGFIIESKQPPGHLRPITGGVCVNCHLENGNHNFVVTTVWHDNMLDRDDCVLCHNNSVDSAAMGKPTGHVSTAESCDVCHEQTIWVIGNVSLPVGHIETSAPCEFCHVATEWTPVASLDHSFLTNNIAIVTSGNCSVCHQASVWTPISSMDHAQLLNSVSNNCDACHDDVTAMGKSGGHVVTTEQCDVCHILTDWLTIITP